MEESTNRCKNPTNYRIVFKSGAITELKDVCLYKKTSANIPPKITYEFYKNENGQDKLISVIFDHNAVDAIFNVK